MWLWRAGAATSSAAGAAPTAPQGPPTPERPPGGSSAAAEQRRGEALDANAPTSIRGDFGTSEADIHRVHAVKQDSIRCVLVWRCSPGKRLHLELSAELATSEGLALGSVHGQLRSHAANVDTQFRQCGISHSASVAEEAAGPYQEEIFVELACLTGVTLVDLVFISVSMRDPGRFSDFEQAEMQIVVAGQGKLTAADISRDEVLQRSDGAILAVFARGADGRSWHLATTRTPVLEPSSSSGDRGHSLPEELTRSLATRLLRQLRGGGVPTAEADANGLLRDVADLVAAGDIASAIGKQERLIQTLTEGSTLGGPQVQFEREFARLEELRWMLGGGGASSSTAAARGGSRSALPPTGSDLDRQLQQARIETLDEEGLQSVAMMHNTAAMAAFIKRVIGKYGGCAPDREQLRGFSSHYSDEEVREQTLSQVGSLFENLLEELRNCGWIPAEEDADTATKRRERQEQEARAARRREADEHHRARRDAERRAEEAAQRVEVAEAEAQRLRREADALMAKKADDAKAVVQLEAARNEAELLAAEHAKRSSEIAARAEAAEAEARRLQALMEEKKVAARPAPVVRQEAPPIEPWCGSSRGGAKVQWLGQSPSPIEMSIGGRPCAALEGGVFVVPLLRPKPEGARSGDAVSVVVTHADGSEHEYPDGFLYYEPGEFRGVEPATGPIGGGIVVRVMTSDLGAPITEVHIGGQLAGFASKSGTTSSEAEVLLPEVFDEGLASIVVRAANGNSVTCEDRFTYYVPQSFGVVGREIHLSNDQLTATRKAGVNFAVCLGRYPLRRQPEGRYFELLIDEVERSSRTIAVGVCTKQGEQILHAGRVRVEEARQLPRVWVAGYDTGGARFWCAGEESKIPPSKWRPVKDVKDNSRIGVLWVDAAPPDIPSCTLVVFQDGEERVRLPVLGGENVPGVDEDLFAVVDLQGVKRVSMVQGAQPPRPSVLPGAEDGAETATPSSHAVSVSS